MYMFYTEGFFFDELHECKESTNIVLAFGIFLYAHLDNMDGKQARRTSTSSPLGMMFDHGCDAMTGPLICMIISKIVQANYWQVIALQLLGLMIYIFIHLEEKMDGMMVLAVINPVDEGLAGVIFTLLLGAIAGNTIFQKTIFGFFIKDLTISFFVLLGVPIAFWMAFRVIRKMGIVWFLKGSWMSFVHASLVISMYFGGLNEYNSVMFLFFFNIISARLTVFSSD